VSGPLGFFSVSWHDLPTACDSRYLKAKVAAVVLARAGAENGGTPSPSRGKNGGQPK
jgi:hypothetical protein